MAPANLRATYSATVLFLIFRVAAVLVLGGCSSAELTRSKAKDIIEASMPFASEVGMEHMPCNLGDMRQAVAKGIQLGLWLDRGVLPAFSKMDGLGDKQRLELTGKGRQYFSLEDQSSTDENSHFVAIYEKRPTLALKIPGKRRVLQVTGIADVPTMRGVKEVTVSVGFGNPPLDLQELCLTRADGVKFFLRLYDDGWRVDPEMARLLDPVSKK